MSSTMSWSGVGLSPPGRFVADAVGRFPIRVDVAGGQRRARFGVLVEAFLNSRRPLRAAEAVRSRSSEDGGVGTMSSSWTVRRARSSAGALRVMTALVFRALLGPLAPPALRATGLLATVCVQPVCVRWFAWDGLSGRDRLFRRRLRPLDGALASRPAPRFCSRRSLPGSRSRCPPSGLFRHSLAAGALSRGSALAACASTLAGGLPTRRSCGLAFGHCSCPFGSGYLDCLPVSDVASSAYRRRKSASARTRLIQPPEISFLAVIAAGGRSPQQKPVQSTSRRTRKEWRMQITGW